MPSHPDRVRRNYEEPILAPCDDCDSSGQVPYGDYLITRDMAIEAGDLSLEGMSAGIKYGPCPTCNGDGYRVVR